MLALPSEWNVPTLTRVSASANRVSPRMARVAWAAAATRACRPFSRRPCGDHRLSAPDSFLRGLEHDAQAISSSTGRASISTLRPQVGPSLHPRAPRRSRRHAPGSTRCRRRVLPPRAHAAPTHPSPPTWVAVRCVRRRSPPLRSWCARPAPPTPRGSPATSVISRAARSGRPVPRRTDHWLRRNAGASRARRGSAAPPGRRPAGPSSRRGSPRGASRAHCPGSP